MLLDSKPRSRPRDPELQRLIVLLYPKPVNSQRFIWSKFGWEGDYSHARVHFVFAIRARAKNTIPWFGKY